MANAMFAVSSEGDASTATTCTGATILGTYKNHHKLLQQASALSSKMHRQVEDVVQMEEEQRLLSQAYRSRQKLAEQEQEQAQVQQKQQLAQQQQQQQQHTASRSAESAGSSAGVSSTKDGGDGTSAHDGAEGGGDAADPSLSPNNITSAGADEYGVVLEGAPDTKRMLQQQAQEKSETLAKMRGMQLAIRELSTEAAAEEERWFNKSHFATEEATTAPDADNTQTGTEEDGDGAVQARNSSNSATKAPRGMPSNVMSKLDAIRDLRTALKDMLDARRSHSADSGSYGSGISGIGDSGGGAGGMTWIEQDAAYRPPAPPQVFSTSALALTLEYVSDSVASLARIADEVCVATTFHARSKRVSLVPYLRSLEKWTAQAERSLETAQRHLRHFQVGETAVLEGGAFEVNSLREQTLLLKETLTAQDQQVKSTMEAKAAVQHRLREIRQRCRMWESHLLHRSAESDHEDKSIESLLFPQLDNSPMNRSTASLSAPSQSCLIGHATRSINTAAAALACAAGGGTGSRTAAGSPTSVFFAPAARSAKEDDSNNNRSSSGGDDHSGTHGRTPLQSTLRFSGEPSDASSPPRAPPPAILKDFLQPPSCPAAGASALVVAASSSLQPTFSAGTVPVRDTTKPPSPSTMDRMERRVSHSWGNPYVRKRLLRQRAEATAAAIAAVSTSPYAAEPPPTASPQDLTSAASLSRATSSAYDAVPRCSCDRSGDTKIQGLEGDAAPAATALSAWRPFSSTPPSGGLSPTTPNAMAFGGVSHTFPRASSREAQRRSRVSVSTPRTPSPGLGDVSERQLASRVFSSAATAAGFYAAEAGGEAMLAELADVRLLQLLQSLLRSVPMTSSLASQQDMKGDHGDDGDLTKGNDQTAEAPLGVRDVTLDDGMREACRRSIQRLIQFVKTQTKQTNPN